MVWGRSHSYLPFVEFILPYLGLKMGQSALGDISNKESDFRGEVRTCIPNFAINSVLHSVKLVHLLYSNVTVSWTDCDWQIPHTLEVAYESLVIAVHI